MGVALSMLIYGLLHFLSIQSRRLIDSLDLGEKIRQYAIFGIEWFLLVMIVIMAAFGVARAAEDDIVTKVMRFAYSDTFMKVSNSDLFDFVLKHSTRNTLREISPRSPAYVGGTVQSIPPMHRPWAIVRSAASDVYEGLPRYFSSGSGDRPGVYLAPACKLVVKPEEKALRPVAGNGVLVLDVVTLEFVDVSSSMCAKDIYHIGLSPTVRECPNGQDLDREVGE